MVAGPPDCALTGSPATDEEFLRLYTLLARRPDGRDAAPLFGYLRAAVRLALSLTDLTRTETEAILRRLARSARTMRTHPTSRNDFEAVLRGFIGL